MKKLILSSLLVVALSPLSVFAGSGKAIVPHWGSDHTSRPTNVFISNITSNYINVTVTFYGQSGTALSPTSYSNFVSSNSQLAPNSSGHVTIKKSAFDRGYAVIEWENIEGDDDTVALIAHGHRVLLSTSSVRGEMAIPINNGMPF